MYLDQCVAADANVVYKVFFLIERFVRDTDVSVCVIFFSSLGKIGILSCSNVDWLGKCIRAVVCSIVYIDLENQKIRKFQMNFRKISIGVHIKLSKFHHQKYANSNVQPTRDKIFVISIAKMIALSKLSSIIYSS